MLSPWKHEEGQKIRFLKCPAAALSRFAFLVDVSQSLHEVRSTILDHKHAPQTSLKVNTPTPPSCRWPRQFREDDLLGPRLPEEKQIMMIIVIVIIVVSIIELPPLPRLRRRRRKKTIRGLCEPPTSRQQHRHRRGGGVKNKRKTKR